jgi:hypothetical protein
VWHGGDLCSHSRQCRACITRPLASRPCDRCMCRTFTHRPSAACAAARACAAVGVQQRSRVSVRPSQCHHQSTCAGASRVGVCFCQRAIA